MINKEPLYLQINRNLKNLIVDEKYAIGDKFLTERTICQKFEVSRATANKSLSSLVSENILEFKRGIGTFIKIIPHSISGYSLWQDPIKLLNRNNVEIQIDIIPNPNSSTLNLINDVIDLQFKRVIKDSNSIIAIEELYMTDNLLEYLTDSDKQKSLYSLINKQKDLAIKNTIELIRSRDCTNEEKKLFQSDESISLLEIESLSVLDGDKSFFLTKTIYKSNQVSIRYENQKNELILNP